MTQRLIFQHKYKSFGCANDVNLSFSDRLLMCKNTILIYYQHISYDLTISPRSQLYSNEILGNGFHGFRKFQKSQRPKLKKDTAYQLRKRLSPYASIIPKMSNICYYLLQTYMHDIYGRNGTSKYVFVVNLRCDANIYVSEIAKRRDGDLGTYLNRICVGNNENLNYCT